MLFVGYWELNETTPAAERLVTAQKVLASGLFPGKNVKLLRWDATPDMWGIAVFEAETAADAQQFLDVWRFALPGFFKKTRLATAMPVQEWMERSAPVIKSVAQ